ncbi:lysosomal protective protein [Ciona intestinalis]
MHISLTSLFCCLIFLSTSPGVVMTSGFKGHDRVKQENWRSTPDLITELPGLTNLPEFNMYSGYLDASDTKKLHYWLNECVDSSSNKLMIWFNGGPGCSSLDGAFIENGPYMFNGKTGTLERNPYSWNQLAHTLYIESPAGVGFSYDINPLSRYNDNITAETNIRALESFFIKFPTFATMNIYLSGQSYAGVYVPTLAAAIVQQQSWMAANLKGILIGNGLMHFLYNHASIMYFSYYHGLFDKTEWDELKRVCCETATVECMFTRFTETDCLMQLTWALHAVWNDGLNIYNLYAPCMSEPQAEMFKVKSRPLLEDVARSRFDSVLDMTKPLSMGPLSLVPPCSNASMITKYFNRADVQQAIHVRPTSWQLCSDVVHNNYYKQVEDTGPQIKMILDALEDIEILLFFGDVDLACNYLGGEWFVDRLGLELQTPRRKWTTRDEYGQVQVAGFYKVYDRLTYATVLGAGHMVPHDKPREAYAMFERYLNDEPL